MGDERASDLVVVLEDGPGRVEAIRRVLADGEFQVVVFTRAPDFAAWARQAESAYVISLDYHLGPREAGTGMDAARVLAALEPLCPVILHSSDTTGARGQEQVLRGAGWETVRAPFSEAGWAAALRWLKEEPSGGRS